MLAIADALAEGSRMTAHRTIYAVVPVKDTRQAKQRLAGVLPRRAAAGTGARHARGRAGGAGPGAQSLPASSW